MPAAEQISLQADGLTLAADSSVGATSRLYDSKWPEPKPKPTLAEAGDGSRKVEDEESYEDRTITLNLSSRVNDPTAADAWAASWEELAAAATADIDAVLVSTFPNGLTLTFDVITASFAADRGHEHFLGEPSGEMTITARPFGREPGATVAGTRTTVDGVTYWQADAPIGGDVSALLIVEADNAGRWTIPPLANRFAVGDQMPTGITWAAVGSGERIVAASHAPPGAFVASISTYIYRGQAQAGTVTPMLRSTNIPAGRWLVGIRCTALPPYANSGSDTYDGLVDVAIAIDGALATPWQQVPGRRNQYPYPSSWWQDSELWRYLEFPLSVPRAGARVDVVVRTSRQARFAAGNTPAWLHSPVLMSASGAVASSQMDPTAMRGSDVTTLTAPMAGNSAGDWQFAYSSGSSPLPSGTGMYLIGAVSDVNGTYSTPASIAATGAGWAAVLAGNPSSSTPAPVATGAYNEFSFDFKFAASDVALGAPYSSLGAPGGGLTFGLWNITVGANPDTATAGAQWNGLTIDIGPKMLAVVAHRSDHSVAGWRLLQPGIVGDAWYSLRLIVDGLGRWWVYLSPSGMRPALVAEGASAAIRGVSGVPLIGLVPSSGSGKSPLVRALSVVAANASQSPSTPSTWGIDGDGSRGPRPKAKPRTRPVIAFRRLDCVASDRSDTDLGDPSTGNALTVTAIKRFLQVPR